MMMSGLRVVSLFLGYSVIGFGGDYAVGLLGQDADSQYNFEYEVQTDVQVDVETLIETVSEIVVEVQVRHGDESCSYGTTSEFTVDASSSNTLVIEESAGRLNIEGREGLERVEVVSELCASSEEFLSELAVSSEVEGNEIIISAHFPETRSNWRGNSSKIDMTVYVPLGMEVEIEDAAGSIQSSGTGNLTIGDAAGSIRISSADGTVRIDDSAGSISISGVTRDLELQDGAGSVTIDGVEGSVTIDDVAGSLRISEVDLHVLVGDVVGSVSVQNVGGDLTVNEIAGGRVSHSGVQGTVDVPEDERRKRRRGGR
jgi:hypothetical protein